MVLYHTYSGKSQETFYTIGVQSNHQNTHQCEMLLKEKFMHYFNKHQHDASGDNDSVATLQK